MGWEHSLIEHDDGIKRCGWPGVEPIYVEYHDTEWGVPEWDDRALFEKLLLDGFQAGLSWITILKKRDAFRSAFDNFEPEIMARYDNDKKSCADAGRRNCAQQTENRGQRHQRSKLPRYPTG